MIVLLGQRASLPFTVLFKRRRLTKDFFLHGIKGTLTTATGMGKLAARDQEMQSGSPQTKSLLGSLFSLIRLAEAYRAV